MTGKLVAPALIAVAAVLGAMSDEATPAVRRVIGEYHVMAVDFHVHTFPQTWSSLSPFEAVIEARRHGLDAIAITPHNAVWGAKVGRWFAGLIGGPIVIVGEEITTPRFHMIGAGLKTVISRHLDALATISEIQRQGGVAIVAHPYKTEFDAAALNALNGAEVVRPEAMHDEQAAELLRAFFAKGQFAAIGASDFHGIANIGTARTFVFAHERSAVAIVEAVRAGRTLAYDRDRVYGDPNMLKLLKDGGSLAAPPPPWPRTDVMPMASRFLATIGLAAALLVGQKHRRT